MSDKKFVTGDLWLASALTLLLNTYPDFETKNNKVLFIFPNGAKTYKAIADYNSNTPLPVFDYQQTVKRLRGEMIKRKEESNGVTGNQGKKCGNL